MASILNISEKDVQKTNFLCLVPNYYIPMEEFTILEYTKEVQIPGLGKTAATIFIEKHRKMSYTVLFNSCYGVDLDYPSRDSYVQRFGFGR